jgi:hypothetical protein
MLLCPYPPFLSRMSRTVIQYKKLEARLGM